MDIQLPVFFLVNAVSAVVIAYAAKHLDRNPAKWAVVGLVCGPILGGMVLTYFEYRKSLHPSPRWKREDRYGVNLEK